MFSALGRVIKQSVNTVTCLAHNRMHKLHVILHVVLSHVIINYCIINYTYDLCLLYVKNISFLNVTFTLHFCMDIIRGFLDRPLNCLTLSSLHFIFSLIFYTITVDSIGLLLFSVFPFFIFYYCSLSSYFYSPAPCFYFLFLTKFSKTFNLHCIILI